MVEKVPTVAPCWFSPTVWLLSVTSISPLDGAICTLEVATVVENELDSSPISITLRRMFSYAYA